MTNDAAGIEKILFVLQSTAIGGMETHCVDLAAEYLRRGLQVAIVVPAVDELDPLAERFAATGTEVSRITTDARDGRLAQLGGLASLARLIRGLRPDAVHLQTGGATGGLAVIALARLLSGGVVAITEHDVPVPVPGRRQRLARIAMDRCAHLVIAVSRRNAAIRRARIAPPTRKFAVILNGVPIRAVPSATQAEHRRRIRSERDLPMDTIVVGSVVRLAESKGLDDLLHAVAIARATAPFELLLVGDGPLRAHLVAIAAQLGIADSVCFAGHQADPAPSLDAMDVFVLAVPEGSMSIALLEAMARGLPPVITFCGPEEAVVPEETGLCAPPSDAEGLASVLARIVTDPVLRSRLAVAAAQHIRTHYSIERVAADTLDAYKGARTGALPSRLRADAAPDAHPGAQYDTVTGGTPPHAA